MDATLERATAGAGNASKMPAAEKTYDRESLDVGNLLLIDHINYGIPDQESATAFYVMGLGFTRDPYLRVGLDNMGINVGRSQFHLNTAGRVLRGETLVAQRVRGTIGFVVPDLGALAKRLEKVAPVLADTQFSYNVHSNRVDATDAFGNRFRCHAPSPEFGDTELAIAYIEFDVPRGTAAGIARFYREGLLAKATVVQQGSDAVASVTIGSQKLLFHETDAAIPAYDGHHISIYVGNYAAPHSFLKKHNLITEESNIYQYRFRDIVDSQNGKVLFQVEHEVRNVNHPLYNVPHINRNTEQMAEDAIRRQHDFHGRY